MSGISEAFQLPTALTQSSLFCTAIPLLNKFTKKASVLTVYMDSPTIAKNFKYNSSQQPMFSVTETPLHYRSFSQNKFTFEDISFSSSSNLNPQDPNPDKNRNTADGTEISIFDAQKYFSNDPKQEPPSDDLSSVPRLSPVSSIDGYGRNFRTRSFHATPTASSEASWNSQSGLLANRPGSIQVSLKNVPSDHHQKKKKKKKKSLKKSIFGQKCCCTGDKSVEVRELTPDFENRGPRGIRSPKETRDIHQPNVAVSNLKSNNSNSIRLVSDPLMIKSEGNSVRLVSDTPLMHKSLDNNSTDASRLQRVSASGRPFTNGNAGFSFPILSPSSPPPTKPEFGGITTKPISSDPPRESLEVFQPNAMTNYTNGRPHFNPGSPIARVTNMDDDVASDASSDLFEIESFSTQTTSYPTYRRRESIDDARRFASGNSRRSLDEPTTPSVAGTECYAPSEFSVDWSVTTAEGHDKGSVTNFSVSASEFGGAAFLRRRMDEEEAARGGDFGKRKGNAGGLSMMGCRQEKAVSVGPQPVKFNAAVVDGPPAMLPLHVSGRPPRAIKPQMGSCNSARLSLAFAA